MQPRPRVLAVAQSADLGGAERALIRLAERLPEHGFDVELATPGRGATADAWVAAASTRPAAAAASASARPAAAPASARPVAAPAAARPAAASARRLPVGGLAAGAWPRALAAWPRAHRLARGFELVLLNGIVTQRLAPAMTTATLVPYIHELAQSPPRAWRSQRFWRSAPIVLCACEAVAERCRALGAPADRLRTIYAPAEAVAPVPRPPWASGPVVGFVGRVEPHKGTLDLAQAMREVEATLVVVGDGDGTYADEVRRAAPDATVFTGPVPDARALMPWFDLLAVPSHSEAFGTVAAEALAAGTPVVATRGSGIEEYVLPGRNGELVMPGDVETLARAIRDLLPRAATMSAAAREAAARFTTDSVAAALADALREALRRRGR